MHPSIVISQAGYLLASSIYKEEGSYKTGVYVVDNQLPVFE